MTFCVHRFVFLVFFAGCRGVSPRDGVLPSSSGSQVCESSTASVEMLDTLHLRRRYNAKTCSYACGGIPKEGLHATVQVAELQESFRVLRVFIPVYESRRTRRRNLIDDVHIFLLNIPGR